MLSGWFGGGGGKSEAAPAVSQGEEPEGGPTTGKLGGRMMAPFSGGATPAADPPTRGRFRGWTPSKPVRGLSSKFGLRKLPLPINQIHRELEGRGEGEGGAPAAEKVFPTPREATPLRVGFVGLVSNTWAEAHMKPDTRPSPEKIECKSARVENPSFAERVKLVDEGLSHLPTSLGY
jgi:hypothetical protein